MDDLSKPMSKHLAIKRMAIIYFSVVAIVFIPFIVIAFIVQKFIVLKIPLIVSAIFLPFVSLFGFLGYKLRNSGYLFRKQHLMPNVLFILGGFIGLVNLALLVVQPSINVIIQLGVAGFLIYSGYRIKNKNGFTNSIQ